MKKIYALLLLTLAMFLVSCNQDRLIGAVKVPAVAGTTTGGSTSGTGGTTTGGITDGTGTTTGGAIVWNSSDSLTNVNVPTTALVNGTLNISFDYATKDYRRVYVVIKSSDWSTEYSKEDIRDLGPSGTKTVNLNLSGMATGNYKVAIEILENKDEYTSFSPQIGSWTDLTIQ